MATITVTPGGLYVVETYQGAFIKKAKIAVSGIPFGQASPPVAVPHGAVDGQGTPGAGVLSSITSIQLATNVVTVVTAAAHGLSVGQKVLIGNVTGSAGLNGSYTVARVVSPTSFTYAKTSGNTGPYTTGGLLDTSAAGSAVGAGLVPLLVKLEPKSVGPFYEGAAADEAFVYVANGAGSNDQACDVYVEY